ncbi:MAG TPA: hypothetical protein VMR50_08365 [Myxococcota bacterium]|nr:hypothetical protein [Myxococcota bacterium]
MSLAANVAIADSAPVDAPPAMVSRWRTWTEATYRDSALFSAVVAEDMPSDVRSEIRVVDSGDFRRWMAIVCGVTLFLFPAKATDHFTLHTEFKNAKGEVLATIEKSESVDSWIGLFLIVVTPFRWPGREVGDLVTELNRATLAEAHAQGIF